MNSNTWKPWVHLMVKLQVWGILSIPSLSFLSGPLCFWVLVPVKFPSTDQIEIFNTFLFLKRFNSTNGWIMSNRIISVNIWNHLTVSKQLCFGLRTNYTLTKQLVSWVFANGSGDRGQIPGWVILMTKKMELDTPLLKTLYYKVMYQG